MLCVEFASSSVLKISAAQRQVIESEELAFMKEEQLRQETTQHEHDKAYGKITMSSLLYYYNNHHRHHNNNNNDNNNSNDFS